ncbi:type II toxin-antitoxin system HicA family toxin [Lactobacillus ultunensis]|uniref:Toxin-antitoxin system, toxin component, HicA family n=1 Tax=Lactobacillus ultunensis DSM 16047 TaxID=525365 RepID=C2ELI3_9LACO|nr:type II toxin-antitoxin system HicA family toxin [Lactobacillus ultunensis]EEJ72631.1 hypothetical protein HMPREF0548_0529 [Lactobacillus ultunensis DSM 16047]KRL81229.1 hypothetical protein FC57_GL000759 [Lactobacillus ultunensis DSM 16047]QQP28174.1 type II toxin-antitoxin system HicA family toxin [Lactobacillus ultunensis]
MVKHTAKEAIKLLKENDFREISVRGDHHKFRNSQGLIANLRYSRLKDTISKGVFDDIKKAIHGQSKWQLMHKKH